MIPLRVGGRHHAKALALAWGIWIVSGPSAPAYGGGPAGGPFSFWGEYGRGPHFAKRGHRYVEFGPPFFTHPMGPGYSYFGTGYPPYGTPTGFGTDYPYYGPYTGAPPYPSTITPTAAPDERPGGAAPGVSPFATERVRSAVKAAEEAEAEERAKEKDPAGPK